MILRVDSCCVNSKALYEYLRLILFKVPVYTDLEYILWLLSKELGVSRNIACGEMKTKTNTNKASIGTYGG